MTMHPELSYALASKTSSKGRAVLMSLCPLFGDNQLGIKRGHNCTVVSGVTEVSACDSVVDVLVQSRGLARAAARRDRELGS